MIYVDANVLLRALTSPVDSSTKRLSEIASRLLQQAERGEIEITTSEAVIAEVAFVLTARTHYDLPVSTAAGLIATIVQLRGFRHPERRTMLRAFDIWGNWPKIGFVDALSAAYAQKGGIQLATFDADFDAIGGIERWEPDSGNGAIR